MCEFKIRVYPRRLSNSVAESGSGSESDSESDSSSESEQSDSSDSDEDDEKVSTNAKKVTCYDIFAYRYMRWFMQRLVECSVVSSTTRRCNACDIV